jgi:zinc protease
MTSSPLPRWTAGVRRRVLDNGLTLLAQREPSAPAVAVITHVKAGFFDEPDRWAGVSHVLEHMFFKGTPSRGPGAVARETKALGGYLNAHTAYDHTAYFVVLPPEGLSQALAVQADALRNSVIDAGELSRELRVIIEEAKRKQDTPSAVAAETLNAVLFDRHRIRRWRIGTVEQLEQYTRDDIAGYYHSRCVPANVIVTMVGDLDPDDALAVAAGMYGDWPPGKPAVDPSPEEPVHREVRARTLRGDVTHAELVLGWRGVPSLDPDCVPLDVAAAILGSGRGSWLYQALREPGIVTDIGAWHYSPTEIGVFSIGAELGADRIPDALGRIAGAVRRLTQSGPSDDDLARARALMLRQWARRMEATEGRAMALAWAEALGGIQLLEEQYRQLETVTPAMVQRAAARVLDPGAVSGLVYLPHGDATDLDAAGLTAAFLGTESGAMGTRPPRWTPAVRGRPATVTSKSAHDVLHTALAGADLLVRRKAGVPVVSLGIYYPRPSFDAPSQAGLGALATRAALRGAGPLDANALAFAFERLGGTVLPSLGGDWFGFGTSILAEHAVAAGELLRLIVEAPAMEAGAVARERDVLLDEVRQLTDDMFRYPFELAFGAAFGGQGYGLPALGTEDTLRSFSAADATAWLAEARGAARPVVIAVGDADAATLSDGLARVFAPLPARAPRAVGGVSAMVPAPEHRVVARDRAQTALAMIFPGPARRDPARYATNVWAAIASGLGGRLFDALRDRRSLAYTVLLNGWQRRRAGAVVSYIATSPEREDEARSTMLEELRRFAEEPVAEDELERAIRYLDGQVRVRRQSASAVAAEILGAWIMGDGLEELDDPGAPYRAVTADQVQASAASALASGMYAEGVVRGRP